MADVYGTRRSETIAGTNEDDLIYGGVNSQPENTGDDTINAKDGDDNVFAGDGNDTLNGEDGSDHLYGDEGNDTLNGGDDFDYLDGGYGADSLNGGDGDDRISCYGGGPDEIDGGEGDGDYLLIGVATSDLVLDISDPSEKQVLSDGTTIVNIEQLSFEGGSGDDWVVGGDLDDDLFGNGGNDMLAGGGDSDGADGGNGWDQLYGGGDSDGLDGGRGRDVLFGGAGDDRLEGEAGNDVLAGGSGADIYIFEAGDGNDTVHEFQDGQDQVDLTALGDPYGFKKLELTDTGTGVLVDYGTGTVLLENVASVSMIDSTDFIFV